MVASLPLVRQATYRQALAAVDFDLVIVDEAHVLKNRASAAWQLVNSLKTRFLLLLSATPVGNNLSELYNLILLLRPGLLKSEATFRRDYGRLIPGRSGRCAAGGRTPGGRVPWRADRRRQGTRHHRVRGGRRDSALERDWRRRPQPPVLPDGRQLRPAVESHDHRTAGRPGAPAGSNARRVRVQPVSGGQHRGTHPPDPARQDQSLRAGRG